MTKEKVAKAIDQERDVWLRMRQYSSEENEDAVFYALKALDHLEERLFDKE